MFFSLLSCSDKLEIDWDLLQPYSTYYVRARYNGDQGHSSAWSDPYRLDTGPYKLEYTIPSQENEQTDVNIHVTHDNGREFDTNDYTLTGYVSHGDLYISGMDATWSLPEVNEDTQATITLWVNRNSDNETVTEKVSKSI
jgi:hypothetical protein